MATNSNDQVINLLQQNIAQLHQDFLSLQKDLTNLSNEVGAIKAGCAAKHRLNLTEEISNVNTKVNTNETNIQELSAKLEKLEHAINGVIR